MTNKELTTFGPNNATMPGGGGQESIDSGPVLWRSSYRKQACVLRGWCDNITRQVSALACFYSVVSLLGEGKAIIKIVATMSGALS